MATLDSVLQDDIRFCSKVFTRNVVASNGVLLPNDIHIPPGVTVCVSGYSLHHNKTTFPKPYRFNYHRFARLNDNFPCCRYGCDNDHNNYKPCLGPRKTCLSGHAFCRGYDQEGCCIHDSQLRDKAISKRPKKI